MISWLIKMRSKFALVLMAQAILFLSGLGRGFTEPLPIQLHPTSGEIIELIGDSERELSFRTGPFSVKVPFGFVREIRLGHSMKHNKDRITLLSGQVFIATDLEGLVADGWRLDDPSILWDAFSSLNFKKEGKEGKEKAAEDKPVQEGETLYLVVANDGTSFSKVKLRYVTVMVGRFDITIPAVYLAELKVSGKGTGEAAVSIRTHLGDTLPGLVKEDIELSAFLNDGTTFISVPWGKLDSIAIETKPPASLQEPEGLPIDVIPIDGPTLPDTRLPKSWKGFDFMWKDFTLHLPSVVQQIKQMTGNTGFEVRIGKGDIRFSEMKPINEPRMCLDSRVGSACIEWAHLASLELPQEIKTGKALEPPRRAAYTIRTLSGGEIAAVSIEGSRGSKWMSARGKDVNLFSGSFYAEIKPEAIAGWERKQDLVTVMFTDGTSLTGLPGEGEDDLFVGRFLLGQTSFPDVTFSVPARQIASIQGHRPLKSAQTDARIRILDRSGKEMIVKSLRAYEERKICGHCRCLGGFCFFSDKDPTGLPLKTNEATVEIAWSDIRGIERSEKGILSCTKKDGSVLVGDLYFGGTSRCECAGETGFVGQTWWGALFFYVSELGSIQFD